VQGSGGFRDIRFGFSSAEKEGADAPELLLDGFFDATNVSDTALWGSPFLFLGYKGSGKTALAEHGRLLADRRADLFVTVTTLDRFSYGDFKSVAGGGGDHQVRYPTAWGWLLLMALVHSLDRDEGGRAEAPGEYRGVVEGLAKLGLMPQADLGLLVTTSSKQSFKAAIPKFLAYTTERTATGQDLQLYQLVAALRTAQRELQFQSLAALMLQAAELNYLFRRHDRPFKFVVLCRTDIFDRLPGSNINKIRQDDSFSLNWYDAPGDPGATRLLRLARLRAEQSLGRSVDVFGEFFPRTIDKRDTRLLLLDHTRHTPRDLVQLLRKIQQHSGGERVLTPRQVKSGIRVYSSEYFLPEMRNELAGYLEGDEIDRALTLLTSVQRPRMTYADLEQAARELDIGTLNLRELVRALFDASCIGTVTHAPGRRPLHTFKYRNPTATVLPGQSLRIHPGALKGLNIHR
jgi:hypothetical protein